MNSTLDLFYQLWCKNLKLYQALSNKIKILLEQLYNTCARLYNFKPNSEQNKDELETLILRTTLEMVVLQAKLKEKLHNLTRYIATTKT